MNGKVSKTEVSYSKQSEAVAFLGKFDVKNTPPLSPADADDQSSIEVKFKNANSIGQSKAKQVDQLVNASDFDFMSDAFGQSHQQSVANVGLPANPPSFVGDNQPLPTHEAKQHKTKFLNLKKKKDNTTADEQSSKVNSYFANDSGNNFDGSFI